MEFFREKYEYWLWRYKSFVRELDRCAAVKDGRIERGENNGPSFLREFRLGSYSLWKTFWGGVILMLLLFSSIIYGAMQLWFPLANLCFLGAAVYGFFASEALLYSASRYDGLLVFRRGAQLIAMLLSVISCLAALSFSAAGIS